MPGPLFNFSAYLGALFAARFGFNLLAGSAVAWLGLFGPGVALMFAVGAQEGRMGGRGLRARGGSYYSCLGPDSALDAHAERMRWAARGLIVPRQCTVHTSLRVHGHCSHVNAHANCWAGCKQRRCPGPWWGCLSLNALGLALRGFLRAPRPPSPCHAQAMPYWTHVRKFQLYRFALPGMNAAGVGLILSSVFKMTVRAPCPSVKAHGPWAISHGPHPCFCGHVCGRACKHMPGSCRACAACDTRTSLPGPRANPNPNPAHALRTKLRACRSLTALAHGTRLQIDIYGISPFPTATLCIGLCAFTAVDTLKVSAEEGC